MKKNEIEVYNVAMAEETTWNGKRIRMFRVDSKTKQGLFSVFVHVNADEPREIWLQKAADEFYAIMDTEDERKLIHRINRATDRYGVDIWNKALWHRRYFWW